MSRDSQPVPSAPVAPPDFSLVLGGPLYQLLRRAHLAGDALELLARRVVTLSLLAWLPLLALSLAEGNAWGDSVRVPFLFDVEVHAKFLLALPLFVVAELVVHERIQQVVRQFAERKLVPARSQARFDGAIASAMRLRNSVLAEVLLIAFVYCVGVLIVWRKHTSIDVASWYGIPSADGKLRPSMAGWWLGCASLPIVQFVLLRWYFRLFIWSRFLLQVSRIDLDLMPMHPDRAGGLGFLSNVAYAFTPVLVGQGVMLSGVMANKIFYAGATLPEFKFAILALVVVMVLVVVGPLLIFTSRLAVAKRNGLFEYGALAQRYVHEFERKWLRGGAPADEPLVGSADIQSLADLANSFEVVRSMKAVPITRDTIIQLVVMPLLPIAPLVLTMISFSELIERLMKVVF